MSAGHVPVKVVGYPHSFADLYVVSSSVIPNGNCASCPIVDHFHELKQCAPQEGGMWLSAGMKVHAGKLSNLGKSKTRDVDLSQIHIDLEAPMNPCYALLVDDRKTKIQCDLGINAACSCTCVNQGQIFL